MAYYWNTEMDKLESTADLVESFTLFGDDYESVSDYITACMWYNNGVLIPLDKHVKRLENDLVRYEEFYDEPEIRNIRDEINSLKRLYLEV